jgi:hypothetical protein
MKFHLMFTDRATAFVFEYQVVLLSSMASYLALKDALTTLEIIPADQRKLSTNSGFGIARRTSLTAACLGTDTGGYY